MRISRVPLFAASRDSGFSAAKMHGFEFRVRGLGFRGLRALGCVLKARVFRGLALLLEFRGSGSGLWEDRSYPALEL